MTLDQVPTEERTAPLNLSQVPLETGLGVSLLFLCHHILSLMPEPLGLHWTFEFVLLFLVRIGMQVEKHISLQFHAFEVCFEAIRIYLESSII